MLFRSTPASWNWSFGDDTWFNTTVAAERNATYTYNAPGTFTARLTVANAGGSNTTEPGTLITVTQAPPVASKIGVFRPSTHIYYQDFNGNGVWNGAGVDRAYNFGLTGDIPVSGDWNNDGKSEIGVFRPSTHIYYQDFNGNGVWNGAVIDRAYNFGINGDSPVSGKWS